MTLPGPVETGVTKALRERGLGTRIAASEPVGGGCINHGSRIATDSGALLFLKWNEAAPSGLFEAEAAGLRALASASPALVHVPEPLAWNSTEATSWLLLEYVPRGSSTREAEERLGTGLAAIHSSCTSPDFGWDRDNWIGSLPQANVPTVSWGEFWRSQRIGPQLETARRRGHLAQPVLDRLLDVIPLALRDVAIPDLLHGDLWGGNWFTSTSGQPVLIDPAVYRGHGEVDLAMSELFGGFGSRFTAAYAEARGLPREYSAYRRDLYQLYYLLVHVNLFGGSYEAGSLRAARRVLAELGG